MDDVVALVNTKKEAIEKLNFIRSFLKDKLCLELNRKTQIFKSTQGVNFCGYKINEYRLKIRDKGKRISPCDIDLLQGLISFQAGKSMDSRAENRKQYRTKQKTRQFKRSKKG